LKGKLKRNALTEQQSSSAEAFKQVKNQVKISTPGISKPIVDKHFRFEAGVGIGQGRQRLQPYFTGVLSTFNHFVSTLFHATSP
jgi:hypothetical protein